MAKTCLIVADSARARFMTLELAEEPALEGGPRLVEQQDLVNPEAKVPERAAFSDRSGLGHGSPAAAAHGFDDHRERHREERERRFCRQIAEAAEGFVAREHASRLLLVAEPRLLGTVRRELDLGRLGGIEVQELGEDVAQRPPDQIQSILALRGALPAAKAPAVGVFHPRGQPSPGR